ncbi:MAG: hypothetical protein U7126_07780 [Microcoleus sp.]
MTYWRQWVIPHGIAGFHGLFDESGEGRAIVENRYTADSTLMKDTARSIPAVGTRLSGDLLRKPGILYLGAHHKLENFRLCLLEE